jgi:hypothetical protein
MARAALWCAALSTSLVGATSVEAHALFGSGTRFLDGVLDLLRAPLAIAGCIGLAAAIAFSSNDRVLRMVGIAMLATCGCCFFSPLWRSMAAPVGCVATGLLAASGIQPPKLLGYVLALIAGASVGMAVEIEQPSWLTALGTGAALVAVTLWAIQCLESLPVGPLARRIVGAWMAATALLLGALALRAVFSIHG